MSNISNIYEIFTASYIFGLTFTSLFMGTMLTFLDEVFMSKDKDSKDSKDSTKKESFVPGKMDKKKLGKTWVLYTFFWFVLNMIFDIIFSFF